MNTQTQNTQTQQVTRLNVTTEQLIDVLLNTPNSIGSFARILQVTNPKLLKKDRVTKVPTEISVLNKTTNLTVLLNTSYESGVVNALNKEGKSEDEYKKGVNTMPLDFTVSQNNFCGLFTPKYSNTAKAVIQYRPFDNSRPTVEYSLECGTVVTKDEIGDILPITNKATNQGSDKEIFWRKLYVSNIKEIVFNGVEYIVQN